LKDIQIAIDSMRERIDRLNIVLETVIFLDIDGKYIQIYPHNSSQKTSQKLTCKLDSRLLRRILDRKSHWNNAEIGCHIDFTREPNSYEPDVHTALQFFYI
jgi:UDP-MurNAc hydroxylase